MNISGVYTTIAQIKIYLASVRFDNVSVSDRKTVKEQTPLKDFLCSVVRITVPKDCNLHDGRCVHSMSAYKLNTASYSDRSVGPIYIQETKIFTAETMLLFPVFLKVAVRELRASRDLS